MTNAVRNGLVGLLAYLGVYAAFFATLLGPLRRDGPGRAYALALAATMIAQMVALFGVSPIGPSERMFWVLVGLAGAVVAHRSPRPPPATDR